MNGVHTGTDPTAVTLPFSERKPIIFFMKIQPQLTTLPPAQRQLWPALRETPPNFVLYGGTAIALQIGHRESVDFDFFSNDEFFPSDLEARVPYLSGAQRLQAQQNTLTCLLGTTPQLVKVSFFGALNFGRVGTPLVAENNGIQIASLLDLAATKIKVIQDRAEYKDYFDLCALFEYGIALEDALRAACGVYGKTFNPIISLRALTYFGDGDVGRLTQQQQKFLEQQAKQLDLEHIQTPISPISGRLTH